MKRRADRRAGSPSPFVFVPSSLRTQAAAAAAPPKEPGGRQRKKAGRLLFLHVVPCYDFFT